MLTGPLLVLSAALLPQAPEAGLSVPEQRKAALIEEIESAAVTAPPVFGIDAQIRAGVLLAGKDPVHAARFLSDAGQRTLLLSDAATRSHFLKRIVPALTPLDASRAESFCAAQSRAEPAAKADPLAVCYDQLIERLKDWAARKEAFSRALAAGACDLPGVTNLLRDAREGHPADFAPLLAEFIRAFPISNPRLEEIRRLESVDRAFAHLNPALSRQARRTLSAARREYAAAHPEWARANPPAATPDAADSLAAPLPADAAAKSEGSFSFGPFFHLPALFNVPDPALENLPDISKLSADQAIELARRQQYAGARAAILADVLDEKDAELDTPRKLSLAADVLRDSQQMHSSAVRLMVQAQLARWFEQQGEKLKAGEAAQALQASFETLVQCEDQRCEVFKADTENSPGELVMTFAEYLKRYNIDPAQLGLNHPGLHACWLLLELQALIEENKQ